MSTLGLIFCLLGSVFTKRRHFRPDPFLSCAERWQDSRAVRDSRGPCSEKGPFLARSSRGVSSDGGLRGISDAWRAYPAKTSPFRMHGVRILPERGDFPVRGHFRDAWSTKLATDCRPETHRGGILPRIDTRERTAQVYCHCQSGQERIRAQSRHRRTLGNAFREHFAIGERPGTHRGGILSRQGTRERIARVYCHCQSGQERIRAQSYHRRTLGNAFREHFVIAGRLGTHSVDILPSADIRECTASAYRHCQSPVTQRSPRGGVGSVPWLCCGLRRATLSVRGSGHSAFSGLNCWERL